MPRDIVQCSSNQLHVDLCTEEHALAVCTEEIVKIDDMVRLCESSIRKYRFKISALEDELKVHKSKKKSHVTEYKGIQSAICKAAKAWQKVKKLAHERSDGSKVITWEMCEMIFSHLWNPSCMEQMKVAVSFQQTCKEFRQASNRYILANPNYRFSIVPDIFTTTIDYQVRYIEDKITELNMTQWAGIRFHKCYEVDVTFRGTCIRSKTTIALAGIKGEKNKCAVIFKSSESPIAEIRMLGGKFKPNSQGYVCNWNAIPTTRLSFPDWPDDMAPAGLITIQSEVSCVGSDGGTERRMIKISPVDMDRHTDYYRQRIVVDMDNACFEYAECL